MPVNGFAAGKWVSLELASGSMRAGFIGVISYVIEMPGEKYCVGFRSGLSIEFTRSDLEAGRVIVNNLSTEWHR